MRRGGLLAGLVASVLLMAPAGDAGGSLKTCKRALSSGQQRYFLGVLKARTREILGKFPGAKPVPPQETAERIAKARLKAKAMIDSGCAGIANPTDADPRQCPGLTFDQCFNAFTATADAIVDAMESQVLPDGPLCLENPVCGETGLPVCDASRGCNCHQTAEGNAGCVSEFLCADAQPCASSLDCLPTQACYIGTCCGPGGVCGPTTCGAAGTGGGAAAGESRPPAHTSARGSPETAGP
ncbi:MAG: hypothetical protein ACE5FG_03535 [Myxococcota bacterium]